MYYTNLFAGLLLILSQQKPSSPVLDGFLQVQTWGQPLQALEQGPSIPDLSLLLLHYLISPYPSYSTDHSLSHTHDTTCAASFASQHYPLTLSPHYPHPLEAESYSLQLSVWIWPPPGRCPCYSGWSIASRGLLSLGSLIKHHTVFCFLFYLPANS